MTSTPATPVEPETTPASMRPEKHPNWYFFIALLVLLIGLWPYLYILHLWPLSRDATIWISKGIPSNAEWHEWVFDTAHFKVCYRPVAALSFTANYLMGGLDALPYRATDLVLHSLVGLFVYLLYRRLAPTLPRWGGLVAAALFMAHPIHDQIVPHLARRSYSLATASALAALLVLCPSAAARGGYVRTALRSLLGGLLIGCALLSNETAYVIVPMVPVLVFHVVSQRPGRWRFLFALCTLPLVVASGAFMLRLKVLAGFGGYALEADWRERVVPIARATWESLAVIAPAAGGDRLGISAAGLAGCAIVGAYYFWRAIIASIWHIRSSHERIAGALGLWLVGYTVFFALLGVWFPRQMYPMMVPVSLLVGVTLATTLTRPLRRWRLAFAMAPQMLLIVWLLANSPVVFGSNPARVAGWRRSDRVLRDAYRELEQVSAAATVHLVLPRFTRPTPNSVRARQPIRSLRRSNRRRAVPIGVRQPERWLQRLLADHGVTLTTYLAVNLDPLDREPRVGLQTDRARSSLVLPPQTVYYSLRGRKRMLVAQGRKTISLDAAFDRRGGEQYVYFHDGTKGELIRIHDVRRRRRPARKNGG